MAGKGSGFKFIRGLTPWNLEERAAWYAKQELGPVRQKMNDLASNILSNRKAPRGVIENISASPSSAINSSDPLSRRIKAGKSLDYKSPINTSGYSQRIGSEDFIHNVSRGIIDDDLGPANTNFTSSSGYSDPNLRGGYFQNDFVDKTISGPGIVAGKNVPMVYKAPKKNNIENIRKRKISRYEKTINATGGIDRSIPFDEGVPMNSPDVFDDLNGGGYYNPSIHQSYDDSRYLGTPGLGSYDASEMVGVPGPLSRGFDDNWFGVTGTTTHSVSPTYSNKWGRETSSRSKKDLFSTPKSKISLKRPSGANSSVPLSSPSLSNPSNRWMESAVGGLGGFAVGGLSTGTWTGAFLGGVGGGLGGYHLSGKGASMWEDKAAGKWVGGLNNMALTKGMQSSEMVRMATAAGFGLAAGSAIGITKGIGSKVMSSSSYNRRDRR